VGGFVLQPDAAAAEGAAIAPPETEDAVPKGWDSQLILNVFHG